MSKKKRPLGGGTPSEPTNKGKITPSSTYSQRKTTTRKSKYQARSNADALAAESAYLLERSYIPNRVKADSPVYTRALRDIRIMVGADE